MSEPDSDELSKIYKDSGRIRVTLAGKKFEKIKIKALEIKNSSGENRQKI